MTNAILIYIFISLVQVVHFVAYFADHLIHSLLHALIEIGSVNRIKILIWKYCQNFLSIEIVISFNIPIFLTKFINGFFIFSYSLLCLGLWSCSKVHVGVCIWEDVFICLSIILNTKDLALMKIWKTIEFIHKYKEWPVIFKFTWPSWNQWINFNQ